MDAIKLVDLSTIALSDFRKHLADCVVLTHDNKLLLQKHPENSKNPGRVNLFGGHVEKGETILQGLIRELVEETGARIKEKDVLFIGAVSEAFTNHTELVHVYFWHDTENTITGCYEREPIVFDSCQDALAYPKLMDYAHWALAECQKRGYF